MEFRSGVWLVGLSLSSVTALVLLGLGGLALAAPLRASLKSSPRRRKGQGTRRK